MMRMWPQKWCWCVMGPPGFGNWRPNLFLKPSKLSIGITPVLISIPSRKFYMRPPPAQETWVAEMKTLLWEGDVAAVLKKCHPLLETYGQPVQRLLTYYTNNQARMQYAHFRQQGYFIGSGTIESGCKQVVGMRLKRPGARWSPAGAEATAKARAAWLSHQWHDLPNLPLAA